MEKLARKSYLHFREHADMMTTKPSVSSEDLRPPPGVPRTLRILAVDCEIVPFVKASVELKLIKCTRVSTRQGGTCTVSRS
jgi:hypothetical protein